MSTQHTLSTLWREAVRDLGDVSNVPHFEKAELTTRAVQMVGCQLYDLMTPYYLTEEPINDNSGSKYTTGATYVSATKTLTLTGLSSNLTSSDVNKWIGFKASTNVLYIAKISSVPSTTSCVIQGLDLPATDLSGITEVHIYGTTVDVDMIDISALPIMMVGGQININLVSTSHSVKWFKHEEFDTFISSASNNKNTLACSLLDKSIMISKGSDISTFSISIRYPRVPNSVEFDDDEIDLPDGAACEIAIIYLSGLIQKRLFGKKEPNEKKLEAALESLFQASGRENATETIKEKVKALS